MSPTRRYDGEKDYPLHILPEEGEASVLLCGRCEEPLYIDVDEPRTECGCKTTPEGGYIALNMDEVDHA